MPVYNGEAFLSESVESVLRQSFTDFELIIVNDGSTDETASILGGYKDRRIRLINNEFNRGITESRNIALAAARGGFIAMLDCDDVCLPGRFHKQLQFLQSNPEFGFVASWVEIECIDQAGKVKVYLKRLEGAPEFLRVRLLFHNCFIQSSVMMRHQCVPEEGYRNVAPSEDYDLWVRISEKHQIALIHEPLVRYRLHPANVTATQREVQESFSRQIIEEQLTKLGISPNARELSMHRNLGFGRISRNPVSLFNARKWFQRLIVANSISGIYKDTEFSAALLDIWHQARRNVPWWNLPAKLIFRSSPF